MESKINVLISESDLTDKKQNKKKNNFLLLDNKENKRNNMNIKIKSDVNCLNIKENNNINEEEKQNAAYTSFREDLLQKNIAVHSKPKDIFNNSNIIFTTENNLNENILNTFSNISNINNNDKFTSFKINVKNKINEYDIRITNMENDVKNLKSLVNEILNNLNQMIFQNKSKTENEYKYIITECKNYIDNKMTNICETLGNNQRNNYYYDTQPYIYNQSYSINSNVIHPNLYNASEIFYNNDKNTSSENIKYITNNTNANINLKATNNFRNKMNISKIVKKKLLDYNVIKIKDDSLFYAIKNGYSEIIQLLFSSKYRESLSKKDSLVISAIKENQTAILSILLENDCTPNAKDENQNSALYISAIKNQDYESSSVLIKFGANVNEINGGKSLLYKARTHKTPNEKITELLISSGAKLTVNEEKDLKYERYSPKNMNRLKRENIFKYDQKINGKIFWIEGRVAGTRNAFLADEYIIKIEDAEENPFGDRDSVDVVIPKYISEKTLEKLSKLEQGSVVSLLVKGRSYTSYVDIVLTDE